MCQQAYPGPWAPCLTCLPPLTLPQHPDQHGSERSVLLAVDQELGECGALDAKGRDPATPSDRTDDQLAVPPLRKTM